MKNKMSKKIIYLLLLILIMEIGCSHIQKINVDKSEIISISQFDPDPTKLEEYAKRINNKGSLIIMIPKGTMLPLKSKIETSIASLEAGENKIHFKRDIYVSISKKGIMISPDSKKWAKFDELNNIRKIFNIEQGEMNIVFGASKKGEPFVEMSVETQ